MRQMLTDRTIIWLLAAVVCPQCGTSSARLFAEWVRRWSCAAHMRTHLVCYKCTPHAARSMLSTYQRFRRALRVVATEQQLEVDEVLKMVIAANSFVGREVVAAEQNEE